jgi:cytochrome c oxidase subunit 2
VKAVFETSDGAGAHLGGLAKNVLVEKGDSWVVQSYEMEADTALVITELFRYTSRNDALVAMMADTAITSFTELKEQKHIELYSKQFDWTTRYAGADNVLGDANFKLIDYKLFAKDTNDFINPLGLISSETVMCHVRRIEERVKQLDTILSGPDVQYIPDAKLYEFTAEMERLKRKKMRIESTIANDMYMSDSILTDINSRVYDDVVVKGELHLVVGQPYEFQFKAQEVIHSAYFPHFRAQINCVPGMATKLKLTPTMTTKEFKKNPIVVNKYLGINKKRKENGEPAVEPGYLLLCNKVCGASHSKMWVSIVVETQEEHDAWMSDQKTFEQVLKDNRLK